MRVNKTVFPGAKFGMLTVVKKLGKDAKGYYRAECLCQCGNTTTPIIASLANGRSQSCGCTHNAKPGVGYGRVVPGAKFTRLTVIKRVRHYKVECRCVCGVVKLVGIDGLLNENIQSCGCLNRERTAQRNRETAKFGGFSRKFPKTFARWNSMVQRCKGDEKGYECVRVCEYLKASPVNFKHLIGVWKKDKPSLDRFPLHNGNYSCGQCDECKREGWSLNIRWTTRQGQSLNRGDFNVLITAFGMSLAKSQWMEKSGLSWSCLTGRLRRGWDAETALTTPDALGNCFCP